MYSGVVRSISPLRGALARGRRTRAVIYLITWCVACASTGCGSTVATSTGPSPSKCGVTLTAPAGSISSAGGTVAIPISTQAECTWNASSEASWMAALTPASGQGAGELRLEVPANPDAIARQGDVLVNGQRARVRQEAAPCRFDLSSTDQTFAPSGGNGRISVTTLAGCAWTAAADASWVSIASGATGTGPGTVTFTVRANSGDARTASVVIGNQTVRIAQETQAQAQVPCAATVTPPSVAAGPGGSGSESISVNVAAGCAWSVSSNAGWIVITGRSSGIGSGTSTFSISSNPGAPRNGTLTVAGQTISVSQASASAAAACSYAVNPLATSVAAAGGAGSPIAVATVEGCAWNAASNTAWLSVTSGGSGSGAGSVGFSALPNTGAARTGSLSVAAQTVTVSQAAAGPSCTYGVTPTSASIPSSGATNSTVSVSASAGCVWTAGSTVPWISIVSGATGSGNGTVTFTVAANTTTASRTATLTVAGQSVTIVQAAAAACTYTVNPTSLAAVAAGGATAPVSVTASGGCAWTATPNASWLSITSGGSGTGNGTVAITAAANTGPARSGTVTVANQTVTVNQAAAACSFAVSPTTASVAPTGGAGTPIGVTTASGCSWTASSGASWISILTGASSTGSGNVTYSVLPNTGAARTGTLTVAGQSVTISQGAVVCVYTIAPTSQTVDKAAGTGGPVTVTTQPGCAWTATSNANWISVTSGGTGTGSGSVSFTVAANPGEQRTGTLTIAGSTFTVTQQKK
jgi:hypothetical protein